MQTYVETRIGSQNNAWIEISLGRLLANARAIRRAQGPLQGGLFAVVKANAYGHGLKEIAQALAAEAAYLGVSSIHEAVELREHGIETPIFLFGRVFSAELPAVVTEGITLCVSSLEEAEEISEISFSLGQKTPVHIKIDTGMGRMGIPARSALPVIEKISALPGLDAEGIFTHFPTAEKEDGVTESQLNDFLLLLEYLDRKGIRFRYCHASNSAASLKIKSPALNLFRPGLLLYGIYPDASARERIHVEPVLTLKSRIIHKKPLHTGDTSGYGRDFVAEKPTTLGILPIGYSQGYPFTASGRAHVLYRGKRYPVAGRVSMDYIAVDFGEDPFKAGDEVILIGKSGSEVITAEELAQWAGTISYEIVTRLPTRIPRFYQ
ncbi:MAG: alanine racemase [Candidatus Omnitrophota bacterium]|jgi:alanine racemase